MKKAKIANLPSGVGITRTVSGRGKLFWRVRLGKRFTGGPIVKRDFSTIAEARDWIFGEGQKKRAEPGPMITLKQQAGASAFHLSAAQISEAAAAFRSLGEEGSLTEAVEYYLKHSRPIGGTFTIQEAIDTLIKDKEAAGKGERHLRGLRWNLERFSEDFPKLNLHEINRKHVEEWLEEEDFSTATRRNYIRDLSILFNFAIRREWIASMPLLGITKPTPGPGEIKILSPEEAAELMRLAEDCCPDVVAPLAIKLFAGLRTSELFALDWARVGKSQITIEAKSSKSRKRRSISISKNLQRWLEIYGGGTGSVTRATNNAWHRRLQHLEEMAKLARKKETTSTCGDFRLPANFARHSFCSYHYAFYKNENLTAAEAGNSPKVIFSNYREMVSKETSRLFWNILPNRSIKKA